MSIDLFTEQISRDTVLRPGTWLVGEADGSRLWARSPSELVEFANLVAGDAATLIAELCARGFVEHRPAQDAVSNEVISRPGADLTFDVFDLAARVERSTHPVLMVLPSLVMYLPSVLPAAAAAAIERLLMADGDRSQTMWERVLRGKARIVAARPLPSLARLLETDLPDFLAIAQLTDEAPRWNRQDPSVLVGPSRPARRCQTSTVRSFHLASALAARTPARVGLPEMMGGSVGETPEEAMPRAIGEAYERYTAGVIPLEALTVAAGADLEDAVDPTTIIHYLPQQFASHPDLCPYEPTTPRIWTRASTVAGRPCQVLADLVYFPFGGPHSARHASSNSSGVAAGQTHRDAVAGAWAELLERDAFMRAWLRRKPLIRLLLDRTPGAGHQPYLLDLESQGWEVRGFALRPDGDQPIVCCLAVRDGQLALGASAAASGLTALTKAMRETWSGAMLVPSEGEVIPVLEDVRTPGDHRRLYRWGQHLDEAGFLWEGKGSVAPADLGSLPPPAPDLITVTWPSWVCEPLHVVRVLHPALIPITFGYGREPLGRRDAAALAGTAGAVPLFPHPFP